MDRAGRLSPAGRRKAASPVGRNNVPTWIIKAADALQGSDAERREAGASRLRDKAAEILEFAPFFAGVLAVVLRKDEVPRVRLAAAQAIGALGSPVGTPYGEVLAAALQSDACSQVREAAARSLGMVGGHLDALSTAAMTDGFKAVRSQAAQSLGCSGLAASQQLEALVDTLAKHRCDVMRYRAATVLGNAGGEASGPYSEALADAALTDAAAGVRLEAVNALSKLGDAAAAPGMAQIKSALKQEDSQTRKFAARAIGAVGLTLQQKEPSPLPSPTSSPKRKGRRRMPASPAKLSDRLSPVAQELVEAALDAAMNDGDPCVRQTAGKAVDAFGHLAAGTDRVEDTLQALVTSALQSESAETRRQASAVLGNMGDLRTVPAEVLAQALDDGDATEQHRAAEALLDLGIAGHPHRKQLAATAQSGKAHDARMAAAKVLFSLQCRPVDVGGKRVVRPHPGEEELSKSLRSGADVSKLQRAARYAMAGDNRPEAALTRGAGLALDFALTEVKGMSVELEHQDDALF